MDMQVFKCYALFCNKHKNTFFEKVDYTYTYNITINYTTIKNEKFSVSGYSFFIRNEIIKYLIYLNEIFLFVKMSEKWWQDTESYPPPLLYSSRNKLISI